MNLGELIICMLVAAILIAVVFVGGNAMINSANLTVVQSDIRSFEVAAQQMLMEHFELQTAADTSKTEELFNQYLPEELKISSGKSAKSDPWKNAYQVSFSTTARSGGNEFYVIITSAGKNGSLKLTDLEADDCGIIIRLMEGEVASEMFGFSKSEFNRAGKNINDIVLGAA